MYFKFLRYFCIVAGCKSREDIFIERFAFILDLKSGQFQPIWIMSKVLTSMLYIYPFAVGYISFGVGYCLLQVGGQSRASNQ